MCTVLLRFAPDGPWPLLVAAVRDEFLERPWDPPAAHWPASPGLIGGRDRTGGGTWLAVRRVAFEPRSRADSLRSPDALTGRVAPAVAALLNGVRLPPLASGARPTRGHLALGALLGEELPDLTDYDGFHLLLGTPSSVTVWSWDGTGLETHELTPGDHIVVNLGLNATDDPLVPHFAPLLAKTEDPPLVGDSTVDAWNSWLTLLLGDGLPGDDPRALLVRKEFEGHIYGSGSASLVAISADRVRYDFTATPATPHWFPVPVM